jgi:hypothetical protein
MKDKEYVLLRDLRTDELFAIPASRWADYKWEVKNKPPMFEEVMSGEKGYLTMLEQLADDKSTKEFV